MKIGSDVGNQTPHFVFKNYFFENRAVYEIMWENIVEPDRLQKTTEHAHCMLDT